MQTLFALILAPSRLVPAGVWAIPLRLIVGYGFMEHGWSKLSRGPESFIGILQALHMPAAPLLAWMTILTELIGGFAVLIGALVPLSSLPMAAVLIVAIVTVHWPNGFSSIKLQAITATGARFGQPGYETDLLYLAALAALVLGGAGPWSVDRLLFGAKADGAGMRPAVGGARALRSRRAAGPCLGPADGLPRPRGCAAAGAADRPAA